MLRSEPSLSRTFDNDQCCIVLTSYLVRSVTNIVCTSCSFLLRTFIVCNTDTIRIVVVFVHRFQTATMRTQLFSSLFFCISIINAVPLESDAHLHQKAPSPAMPFTEEYALEQILFQPWRWTINRLFHRNIKVDLATEELVPWELLNVPSYGNWTDDEWNIHLHGNAYRKVKFFDVKNDTVDDMVNKLLLKASIRPQKFWRNHYYRLNSTEADFARAAVKELSVNTINDVGIVASTDESLPVWTRLQEPTNSYGDFDGWVGSSNISLPEDITKGDDTQDVQTVDIILQPKGMKSRPANFTQTISKTMLVPPEGVTIVSDIDDVLRVAEIWNWKQALLNLFARPLQPWLDMPDIFKTWEDEMPTAHFHYISDTPQPNARYYIDGILAE